MAHASSEFSGPGVLMPFIVKVTRPCPACVHGPNAGGEHRPDSVSRFAFETLEDAKDECVRIVDRARTRMSFAPVLRFVDGLPEAGGTITLPDGMTVQVEPSTYFNLWNATPWDSGLRGGPFMETDGEQNIAGFNAYFNAKFAAGSPSTTEN